MTTSRLDRVYVQCVYDPDPDLSWLEQDYNDPSITPEQALQYRAQDAARLDAYRAGDWHSVGVRLATDIVLTRPGRVDETITLTTPGVWGVESDSGDDYFVGLARDEAEYLVDDLVALGLSRDLVWIRIERDLELDRAEVVEA